MFEPISEKVYIWTPNLFQHREVNYSPDKIRLVRQKLYALTDNNVAFHEDLIKLCDGLIYSLDGFSDADVRNSAFYIYFSRAEKALPALRRIVKCGGVFAPPPIFDKVPFLAVSAQAIDSLNMAALRLDCEAGSETGAQLCQAAELTRGLQGDFVEIGVFSGGSALASLMHMQNIGVSRRCWLLDTYSGFTYEAAKESSDVIWAGTHLMDPNMTIERIQRLTSNTVHDVHVVANNICVDDLPREIEAIAFANIDVDMYDAVLAALTKIGPRMVKRGIMVVEDPTATPGLYGAYLALNEFLDSELGKKFISVRTTTQYFVIRIE